MHLLKVACNEHHYEILPREEGGELAMPRIGDLLPVPPCLRAEGVSGALVIGIKHAVQGVQTVGEILAVAIGEES